MSELNTGQLESMKDWGLFRILGCQNDISQLSKIFTQIVTNHLLKLDYNYELEIENIILETEDEGKQIHLIAQNLREDYFYGDYELSEFSGTKDNRLCEIVDFLVEVTCWVDLYEVARIILKDYKEKLGKQNKKSKKAA